MCEKYPLLGIPKTKKVLLFCEQMGRIMHKGFLRLLSVILLLVMTILVFNNTVYTHVHVMPDGSLVAHAHPFRKGDEADRENAHTHSSMIFFLLDHLELLFVLAAALLLLNPMLNREIKPIFHSVDLSPSLIHSSPGRAPPSSM